MSFPYINAFQQFFDSSGDPLVSGTIEFRDPTSNSLINSYPTASDADAQTDPNDNPLTLNAKGAAERGLFLEDGVAYKVILKDANGATVKSDDNVRCPIALPYLETAAETAAGVTPTNVEYPPWDVRRYGATGDGTTNDTAAFTTIGTILDTLGDDVTVVITIPKGDYLIDAITWDKDNLTVIAYGARFIPNTDVTLFDLNSGALADSSVIRRGVTWLGGYFDYGDSPTTLIATAIKNNSARSFRVRDVRFRGIKNCITTAILDTLRVRDCYFRNTEKGVYIPDFFTSNTSQDTWITGNTFSCKAGITMICIDVTGGGYDITVKDNGTAFTTGKLYYHQLGNAQVDGGVTIENNATEQATNQTLVHIDENATTVNLDGIDVIGNTFGSSGATVLDIGRAEGAINILRNKFDGTSQTAIKIDILRPEAICIIEGNRFDQTATAVGTLWDITPQTTAEVRIGVNSYDADIGTRTISSNTTITYQEFRNYAVASATTIAVEPDSRLVEITGTTQIDTITATWKGHRVSFLFNTSLQVTDGSNLKLGANFAATADDILTLICDGTNWYQEGNN